MKTFRISNKTYSYQDLAPFISSAVKIIIDKDSRNNIKDSYSRLKNILSSGQTVYGVNTGFGRLSQIKINESDQIKLQKNLVRSHSAGLGTHLDVGTVRVIILLKVIGYVKGYSGIHPDTIKTLQDFLNNDIIPILPIKGSVGASGDLAPLAHLASALIGEGKVLYNNKISPSGRVLKKLNIRKLILHEKDGISLVNGTQFSTALAIKCLNNCDLILQTADAVSALSVENSLSSRNTFHSSIHRLKKHKGQILSAKNIWKMTSNSEVVKSHKNCDVIQDPYSFRCIPHIHGASRDIIDNLKDIINNEINSVSDNPLILKNGKVEYSGHFHAEHVAQTLDSIAVAIAEIGSISERRIHFFMKGASGKLPLFLAKNPGLESGYMIAHVTATALASENKTLSHPASVDSMPTSGGQEDLVSMAPWSSEKLLKIQENVINILAIETLVSSAAFLLFHSKMSPGKGTKEIIDKVKHVVQYLKGDRELSKEINELADLIKSGELIEKLKHRNILE